MVVGASATRNAVAPSLEPSSGAGGSLFDDQTAYPHAYNGSLFNDQMAPFSIDKYNAAGVSLGPQQRQQVWDALAIAAYHAQTSVPIVRRLLSDDAAVYHLLTDEHALCWIHDARHYAKLTPVVATHRDLLTAFRTDYWAFYRQLLAYRTAPTATRWTRRDGCTPANTSRGG